MKTLREAMDDIAADLNENFGWSIEKADSPEFWPLLERYISPLLTPPPDTRKAEVARIAEALYIRCVSNPQFAMTNAAMGSAACFADAEAFVAYKESLK